MSLQSANFPSQVSPADTPVPQPAPAWLRAFMEGGRAVDDLIGHGDINRPVDGEGNTLLHLACRNGDLASVRLLIGSGANVHAMNDRHQKLFRVVCEHVQPEEDQYAVLRELALSDRMMARHIGFYAVENNRWEIYALLMAEGILQADDLGRCSTALLQSLDVIFRCALTSGDETIPSNCIIGLCHTIVRVNFPSARYAAVDVMKGWNVVAGPLVRQTYEECRVRMNSPRLNAFAKDIAG